MWAVRVAASCQRCGRGQIDTGGGGRAALPLLALAFALLGTLFIVAANQAEAATAVELDTQRQDHRPKQGALHRPLLRTRRRVQLFGWSNRLRPGDERQHLRAELPDHTVQNFRVYTASIRVAGSTYHTPGNHKGWYDVIGIYYYIRFAVTPQTPEDAPFPTQSASFCVRIGL